MVTKHKRYGLTLIELLVTLIVLVTLLVIFVPVTLRMQDRDRIPRAGQLIQGALLKARSQALHDRKVTGVRFLPSANNAFHITQLEFVQEPGDFVDGWVFSGQLVPELNTMVAIQPVINPPNSNSITAWVSVQLPGASDVLYGPYSFTWSDSAGQSHPPQRSTFRWTDAVRPGDWVEVTGNGQLYQITGVFDADPPLPARLVLDRPLLQPIHVPTNLSSNYRIIRKARPLAGEKPVSLPQSAVVDITPNPGSLTTGLIPSAVDGTIDLLFNPAGLVVGAAAAQDMVYIHVRDLSPDLQDNEVLVVVYTRTGAVSTYPVDRVSGDPYLFARQGRGGGV
ncbi:MAG: hypothetical protein C4297_02520 [Gemmataceae bacterium]